MKKYPEQNHCEITNTIIICSQASRTKENKQFEELGIQDKTGTPKYIWNDIAFDIQQIVSIKPVIVDTVRCAELQLSTGDLIIVNLDFEFLLTLWAMYKDGAYEIEEEPSKDVLIDE